MNKKILTIALAMALVFGIGSATAQNLGAAQTKKPTIGVIFNGEGIPGATEGGEGPLPGPKTCMSGPAKKHAFRSTLRTAIAAVAMVRVLTVRRVTT